MTLKYGSENPQKVPKIRKRTISTLCSNGLVMSSKQQIYINNLYGGELNVAINKYSCDIVIENDKIIIEYDGGGHNLRVVLGALTEEEFKRKEIIRNITLKKEGYKQMHIISHTDKLPSDEILLQMLELTKQYFADYPEHSWREWYLDEGIYKDAEHKGGEQFDFGTLRKIKSIA